MNSNDFINQIKKDNQKTENEKKFTYGEIVSVGRKLRQYENVLNNLDQFKEAFEFVIGNQNEKEFQSLESTVLRLVVRYRHIYNNMLNTIN